MQKEGQVRIPSGCAIVGAIDRAGGPICGEELIRAIAVMHDRSNGLGGGFAGYGIYPQYKELYAFHLFYEDSSAKETCERFLERHFDIVNLSKIPTRPHPRVTDAPLIWRYFMAPLPNKLEQSQLDEREYVRRCVTRVNTQMKGAHVFSSGKNMGVFKAVGYPEDVGEFYRLEEYEGYAWTAHGRYPTNTPGWWGGAHPFALLDYSVVHNGEISSYDANRRFIEMFGYPAPPVLRPHPQHRQPLQAAVCHELNMKRGGLGRLFLACQRTSVEKNPLKLGRGSSRGRQPASSGIKCPECLAGQGVQRAQRGLFRRAAAGK